MCKMSCSFATIKKSFNMKVFIGEDNREYAHSKNGKSYKIIRRFIYFFGLKINLIPRAVQSA